VTLEPGWSWEKYVNLEKTDSCQVPHISLILSPRARTVMGNIAVVDADQEILL
jgi:hypothetical protein